MNFHSHRVTQVRPTQSRDELNALTLDYENPLVTRILICKIQLSRASADTQREGQQDFQGELWTTDKNVLLYDRLTYKGEYFFIEEKAEKENLHGVFSHVRCVIMRRTK